MDNADTDPANWLTDNKGYLGYRFSALSSINADNAHKLKQICSFPLGLKGSFQNGPIVYDGALYTTTAFTTAAIDAATCKKRWQYDYKPDHPLAANNKGAAIAAGRVIRGTPDGHLIALDAKTGALLWDRQIMDATKGEFATAAPLIWDDMVFIGKAGADLGIRGEMMAFTPSTERRSGASIQFRLPIRQEATRGRARPASSTAGARFGPASASIPPPACCCCRSAILDLTSITTAGLALICSPTRWSPSTREQGGSNGGINCSAPTTATGTPTSSRRSTALTEANS